MTFISDLSTGLFDEAPDHSAEWDIAAPTACTPDPPKKIRS